MERRRFTLMDAMALIAATAVGMGLVRAFFLDIGRLMPLALTTWDASSTYLRAAGFGPLVAAWSVAALGLHLIRPRPPIRRLARSPAFAAGLAATFAVALLTMFQGARATQPDWAAWVAPPIYTVALALPETVGIALVPCWIVVAAGGGWRGRRGLDWRERLGRALGWAWLALFAARFLQVTMIG